MGKRGYIAWTLLMLVLALIMAAFSSYYLNRLPNLDAFNFIAILWIIGICATWLYSALSDRYSKAKANAIAVLTPFLDKEEFKKAGDGRWEGYYRKRKISIWLSPSRGLAETILINIQTPNQAGKDPGFDFSEKNKMQEHDLAGIYDRLKRLGLLDVPVRASPPFSKWGLFGAYNDRIYFSLPGSLLNNDNFIESIGILCDTSDRIGL